MNNISLIKYSEKLVADLLIVLVGENQPLPTIIEEINKKTEGALTTHLKREKFIGQKNKKVFFTTNGKFSVPKILCIGIGQKITLTDNALQAFGGELANVINEDSSENIAIDTSCLGESDAFAQIAFGIALKSWKFDKYRSKNKDESISKSIQIRCQNSKQEKEIFSQYCKIYDGIVLARELTAEPANMLFPDAYAERCNALKNLGVEVSIFNEKQLLKMGAHALLAVGKGSANPPRMVTLHWKGGSKKDPTVALVGKGVCFDSGGINIKTSHLTEMKWDKAGASTVVGTLFALAKLNAPVNVVGVIGLVENMPDGNALKPGDIISTMEGISVEVVDTDNEGRLVLADCLTYAQKQFSPDRVIDLGTLTLETFGALAGEYAGLFCEDLEMLRELIESGNTSGEKLWPLPMGEPYAKQIQSQVADIKNMGILGYGESSAAAEFLKCFIQPGVRWAHLDISGVAWSQEALPLSQAGVTGFGVRFLTTWITEKK